METYRAISGRLNGLESVHGMSQSRGRSLAEAGCNVFVGFWLGVFVQVLIFPLYGIKIWFGHHMAISLYFVVLGLFKSYLLRRAFNWGDERTK